MKTGVDIMTVVERLKTHTNNKNTVVDIMAVVERLNTITNMIIKTVVDSFRE